MSEPFIGEIKIVPYNFAPRGWAFCNGQLLPIAQNTALFSIIGTTYGGDGQTTFGLPNLMGRVAPGSGQGPGLSAYALGQTGGSDAVALTTSQLPPHSHGLMASGSASGKTGTPGPGVQFGTASANTYGAASNLVAMAGAALSFTGGQPHGNRQPYLGLNFVIAIEGIFPSRN